MLKTPYKKVRRLRPSQTAYLAGLIDGEGTITLTRKNKDAYRRIGVTISNTEYPILKWVLKNVGVGEITNKKSYDSKWTPSYSYQIYSQQALDILKQILPYLQSYKKKRAALALKNYKRLTPRNGKYSKALLTRRAKFIEDFFKIKTPGLTKRRIII